MEERPGQLNAMVSDEEEQGRDYALRPRTLSEYIGQSALKANLEVFIRAARGRAEPLDHALFAGPPGLGKTTLAHVIACEMGVQLTSTSGPVLERGGDLAAILTNLQPGDVLFIDEIHRLNRTVEELLYPAMEDFELDIVLGQGPGARSVKFSLPRFTLVGATTRAGLLTGPLRTRFGINETLEWYSTEELQRILERSAGLLEIELSPEGSRALALRSRGTPRIANRLLRRVRDFADVKGDGRITAEIAAMATDLLGVDSSGLDRMDRRILTTIIDKFDGGPVGLTAIAAAIGEEADTVEEVYEPYLLQQGLLNRTKAGRVATLRGWAHLGREVPARLRSNQGALFE